jgi:hypothetical protein
MYRLETSRRPCGQQGCGSERDEPEEKKEKACCQLATLENFPYSLGSKGENLLLHELSR